MKEMDDNLDLLDLEEETGLDSLPATSPFAPPRPKKPWLLLGVGLLVIVLATYIIVRVIGSDSNSSMEVDLDAPAVVTIDPTADGVAPVITDTIVVPAQAVAPAKPMAPAVLPVPEPKPVSTTPGVPVREVADRKEVTFNPNKAPVAKPAVKTQLAVKPAAKLAAKINPGPKSAWYVQFGSYSTRALAESAQKKINAGHTGLLADKQFVILAAILPNGTTTYRLRVGFSTSADANSFCRNAKSDGLDCYVAK